MFVQIAKEVEDRIRSSGWLSLELVTRGLNYDNYTVVYTKVIKGVETPLRRLFTCSVCNTEMIMMLWEIKIFESNALYLDEAEQYLFLQMLVEAVEGWALKKGLMSISMSSDLPHISEILIDNRFTTLKTIEFIPGIKTYSGIKSLKKIIEREEI